MAQWRKLLTSLVQDTTPRLGGDLNVLGNKIISATNGDIWLDPDGTGYVKLGTLSFKADTTLGAQVDNYVLTYDHTAGVISLEASQGGGAANMENDFSAPASTGAFQNGARLAIDAYGTAQSATAGTLVSFGNTNVGAVGAQSSTAAATGMLTVVTDAGSCDELLIEGVIKMSSNSGWNLAKKGTPLYMSTTAGQVTSTAPSTSGDIVRVIGYAVDASNSTIYFNPSVDWIEL